jgi:hypothetical protein
MDILLGEISLVLVLLIGSRNSLPPVSSVLKKNQSSVRKHVNRYREVGFL